MIGTLLKGRFRIDGVLGEGAMGIVYRGVDVEHDSHVAIKTLQPAAFHSVKARERFEREATNASKLAHPGIVQILDFGVQDNTPFLIMELVEGAELTDILDREGPMPPGRALTLMLQLVMALKEAHAKNLVHRDIKPANLRLMGYVEKGPISLKVLDFGIAKDIGQEKGKLTSTGAIMGTPLYLAPEQAAERAANIDGRTDQYQAGIVFYELLTGHTPFAGSTVASILLAHISKPPPPLPRTVPEQIQRVILRMLRKRPQDRYPDDEALLRALEACEKSCRNAPAAPKTQTPPKPASALQTFASSRIAVFSVISGLVMAGFLGHLLKPRKDRGGNAQPPSVMTPLPEAKLVAQPSVAQPPRESAPPQVSQAPINPTPVIARSTKSAAKPTRRGAPKSVPTVNHEPPAKPVKDPYEVDVAR